jgi:hypothetical protein
LEKAKLIEKQREGRQNYCSLKLDAIREVSAWAENYRKFVKARSRCGRALQQEISFSFELKLYIRFS